MTILKAVLILLLFVNHTNAGNSNSTKYIEVGTPRLYLQLSDGTTTRETSIIYFGGSTEGLDPGYDAGAYQDGEPSFALYSRLPCDTEGIDFALNVLPLGYDQSIVVPVSVFANAGKTLTFSTRTNSDLPINQNYYIEDRQNNTYNKISGGSTYATTTASRINGIGRFFLHTAKIVWLGNTSDWNVASNWSTNTIPSLTDNLLITNAGVNPTATGSIEINNVTIASGASLTVNSNLTINGILTINSDPYVSASLIVKGNATGTITYKRDVSYEKTRTAEANGWHLFGAPVIGESIQDIITNGNLASNNDGTLKGLASYNNLNTPTSLSWLYKTSSSVGALNSGQGYSVKRNKPCYIAITGTLKTDDLTSYPITEGSRNSWNLMANPYPSFINANLTTNSFLSLNSDQLDASANAIYIWDSNTDDGEGAYKVINYLSPNYYLNPGQGFFVLSKNGGGLISITESLQTHKPETTFSKSNKTYSEIKLFVSNEKSKEETTVKYAKTNVSEGLDRGYDAKQFSLSEKDFSIATHLVKNSKGVNFMLQALPKDKIETTIVPISLQASAGETIIFEALTKEFPEKLNVFLEDKLKNIFTILNKENASYAVLLEETQNGIGRFYMHISSKNVLNTKATVAQNKSIYVVNHNTLRITGIHNKNVKIQIFDMLGKSVLNETYNTKKTILDVRLNQINKGVYLVDVITEQGKIQKKIIVN